MSEDRPGRLRGRWWLWSAAPVAAALLVVLAFVLAHSGGGDGEDSLVATPTPPAEETRSPTATPTPTAPATPTATTTPTAVPTPQPAPAPVVVTPAGEQAPRLSFMRIAFLKPPPETEPAQLVSLDPPIDGSFVWVDERTLLFQPEFPGWDRGGRYRVVVDGTASGLDEDHEHAFTVEGQLEVQYVIPGPDDRDVPLNAQIMVQFNRSVAPLTVLQERPGPPVLKFDPPLAGEGEWLNTSLYRFIPSDLRPSTPYQVLIPAGLTSAADGVLEEDFAWSFTTVLPRVSRISPGRNSEFVEQGRDIVVTFNQPMDRASVQSGLSFSITQARSGDWTETNTALGAYDVPADPAVPVLFVWNEDGTVVTLKPFRPLRRSTTYTVIARAGMLSAAGAATPSERTSRFSTLDWPRLESTDPTSGALSHRPWWDIGLDYNNPMDATSFSDRVSVSGIDPDDIDVRAHYDGAYIDAPLDYSTRYTVTVDAGVRDRGGAPLPAYEFSFTTGDPAPPRLPDRSVDLSVPNWFATYSAATEQELFFTAVNAPTVQFRLHPLTEAEARTLLSRGYVDRWKYVKDEDTGGTTRVWMPFEPSQPSMREWGEVTSEEDRYVRRLYSTSLGDGPPLPKGDYVVFAEHHREWRRKALVISVVDTAIIAKQSHDQVLAWVLDYETGEPLNGVRVESIHAGGALTGPDGLADLPVQDSQWGTYLLRLNDDGRFGVASTQWTHGSSPWQLPVPFSSQTFELLAHLYTERPIYRTGETVSYKAVIRRDDDATYSLPGPDETFTVVVRDSKSKELSRTEAEPNEFGTLEGEFVIPEGGATGTYTIELRGSDGHRYLQQGPGRITSTTFTVEQFRVPEFRVTVATPEAHYIDGEQIPVETTAEFYFGGGVEGATVNWSVLSSPTSIHAEGYEDYSFSNRRYYWPYEDSPLRAQGSAEVGAGGVALFEVTAALQADEGTQVFTISATARDESAQAVAASSSVRVHPAAWYAGIRTDSYIAKAGEPETVRLVTVDIESRIAPHRPVTVRAYEQRWVTTKVGGTGGSRSYTSELVETEIELQSVTTRADGEASITFTPPASGAYRLVAESVDNEGRVARSSTYLWVSGRRYAPWRVRNDDLIDLIPDQEGYEVGDVAEVLVPAPFAGATGLVTIERGGILHTEVRAFETNSEVLRIPIEDHHLPNIYVSVVLYRPPTDDDPLPRYLVGYTELPVSTAPRRLDVRIEPDRERAAPGETVRYEVTVTDWLGRGVAGEVSVAIADQAVLSLADEVGPNGMRAFWFQRALGVATFSSLGVSIDRHNDILKAPEGASGKGGGGDTTRLRSDFRNTALWIGQLETDEDGKASFELELPDNATTWRAQARAVSGTTQVGEATSELLVTQPLLVRPALPRFLRVGDEVTLRTLVRNGTTSARIVTVTVQAEGVTVDGSAARTVRIQPDRSAVFEWTARAVGQGTARVRFDAAATGGFRDAVEVSLPVHLNVTAETTATGGAIDDALAVEAVYLPDYAIRERGELEISVQGSLVGTIADELHHFAPRHYEWSERVASRVIATVAAKRSQGGRLDWSQTQQLRADVARLISMQRYDGGWAWCRQCQTNLWITAWALIALGEASDGGAHVPVEVAEDASNLISRRVHRTTDVDRPADPSEHAFLLYALTSAGRGSGLVALQHGATMRSIVAQDRSRLTNWGRAYLLLGLLASGHDRSAEPVRWLLNDLTADIIASANGNHWEDQRHGGSMHNSSVRTTALVLRALAEVDPRHPLIEETVRWLVLARSQERWKTGVARAQAMSSLGAYAETTGESLGRYDYAVWLDTRQVLAGAFNVPAGDYVDGAEIALTELPLGEVSRVQFERDASRPGRMYYGLNLRYITPARDIMALNRGFAISHRYSLIGNPDEVVTSAELGDVVRVQVTIVAPHDRLFVLVEDYLPAGLEPINPNLRIVAPELTQQLEADRRDTRQGAAPKDYAPWYAWYYSPWRHVDIRDDRLVLQADRLPRGVHEYVYYARATTPGDFIVPPARVEESYFPEVFGRSDSGRFSVLGE